MSYKVCIRNNITGEARHFHLSDEQWQEQGCDYWTSRLDQRRERAWRIAGGEDATLGLLDMGVSSGAFSALFVTGPDGSKLLMQNDPWDPDKAKILKAERDRVDQNMAAATLSPNVKKYYLPSSMLQCPFCRHAGAFYMYCDADTPHVVICWNCKARGPTGTDEQNAIKLWNER